MKCPRCGVILQTAPCDGQTVEACPGCKGEWLHAGELQKLVEHHNEVFSAQEIQSLDAVNKEIQTCELADHDELNCPVCGDVRMEHFNYGDSTGIVLHKCAECGGVWMDKGELEKVEEVVDGWKADLQKDEKTYGKILDKIEVEEQKQLDQAVSISHIGFINAILRRFCE